MNEQPVTPYELWQSLEVSRMPLSLILKPSVIEERKVRNKFPLSDSAFVHRMFDLFFPLDYASIKSELTESENIDLQHFIDGFRSLDWRPIDSHPHISELADPSTLAELADSARALDLRLKRRVSHDPLSTIYRLFKGWPVSRPERKEIGA
jgi:hypothetical protein